MSVHDTLKNCFVLLYFCYFTGLIGALVILNLMLPIFYLTAIELCCLQELGGGESYASMCAKQEAAHLGDGAETEHKE